MPCVAVNLDQAELLLAFYYCGTADSTHYSAKTASGAHGAGALQHITHAHSEAHDLRLGGGMGGDRYVCKHVGELTINAQNDSFYSWKHTQIQPPAPGSVSLLTVQGWGGLVYCDRAKKAQVSAVPCCPGRCLPPGAPSLLR